MKKNQMLFLVLLSVLYIVTAKAQGIDISHHQDNIEIEDTLSLRIYYPQYGRVDHHFETMPLPNDPKVIFCCAAAFTGELLKEFKHSNIAGNHISSGVYYNGYRCKANTGCFAYYADDGSWKFAVGDYNKYLQDAAKRGGCGFGQSMLIYNGKQLTDKGPLKSPNSSNYYRVLAEYKGRLCIIDSNQNIAIQSFINNLVSIGVTHALYLDMGSGWNFSYYRDNSNQVHYIHNKKSPYSTNWITFYSE